MKVLPVNYHAVSFGVTKKWNNSNDSRYVFVPNNEQPNETEGLPGYFSCISLIPRKSNPITSPKNYREYAKDRHVGCVYCGNNMFVNSEKVAMLNFCKEMGYDAKSTADFLLHFASYFNDKTKSKINMLKQIRDIGNKYPRADLKFAIQAMSYNAEQKLVTEQEVIMDDIRAVIKSADIHPDKKYELNQLVDHSLYRIHGIPYVSKYSAKEFYYQICQMTKTMDGSRKARQMEELANFMNNPRLREESDAPIPANLINRMYKLTKFTTKDIGKLSPTDRNVKFKIQSSIVRRIKDIGAEEGRSDIMTLCDITQRKLERKPVVLQFSNKAFRYKLAEILANVDNEDVKNKFGVLVEHLPTSVTNINAFIVKHKNSANSTIIWNFLSLADATIEHIIPKSEGGSNTIGNMVLACSTCNGIHGSRDIKGEKYPFDTKFAQPYFDTVIEDTNEKDRFLVEDVISMAKNYFKVTGIKIDTSNLRYKPSVDY